MKTFLSAILMSITIFIAALLGGCSGGSGDASTSTGNGAVTAKLVWQQASASKVTKAAAPAAVTTVRVIITAVGMTTIQQDYAAGDNGGSISNIPAGTGRTFTFQGINASSSVTHQAVVSNVTITAGQTTDLGIITMLVVVPPIAPASLGATSNGKSSITLTWVDSDQLETGFVIERKTGAGGVWAQIATPAANSVTYSDTGLAAGTTYYYRVKATNSAGDSAWSSEATATTAAIDLAKTGQTISYATGDDGNLQKGVAWPSPRFTNNSNGTVTDNLTGLIWLKNANCFGGQTWANALNSANSLASGSCGLTDGSSAGQWRLPNIVELESLIDIANSNPALPSGHPFSVVQATGYWSATTYPVLTTFALSIYMTDGRASAFSKVVNGYVWPVRGGQ